MAVNGSVEHTLAYDYAILGDGAVPRDTAEATMMPTLVMSGEKSFDFMQDAAQQLAKFMPRAQWMMLKDQDHQVSPEVPAPVLTSFFKNHSSK
jgi:pimeloyl-ACP methyl ester carboxylesterase